MRKKDTAKKAEAKSCFTVSDWVTFLSNERQGMMSNVVTISVFLVAAIALILATSAYVAFAVASGIIVFGCAGWVYFRVLEPLRQRGHLADELLRKIISGEFTNSETVRREWVLGLTVISRGLFLRQAKARIAVLKRAWHYQWKPRLVAFKEASQRKWEAALAALKETWCREKARLVALKERSQHKWEEALAALRQTWHQQKARLATLGETWHLW